MPPLSSPLCSEDLSMNEKKIFVTAVSGVWCPFYSLVNISRLKMHQKDCQANIKERRRNKISISCVKKIALLQPSFVKNFLPTPL